MIEDTPVDFQQPDEYEGKKEKTSDALQQAEALLAAAQTVEDFEQVRELFRWIHRGI